MAYLSKLTFLSTFLSKFTFLSTFLSGVTFLSTFLKLLVTQNLYVNDGKKYTLTDRKFMNKGKLLGKHMMFKMHLGFKTYSIFVSFVGAAP